MEKFASKYRWTDYLLPAVLSALAFGAITNQLQKAEEEQQQAPKAQLFQPAGPGPMKEWVREAHRIERLERAKMPRAIGWKGYQTAEAINDLD